VLGPPYKAELQEVRTGDPSTRSSQWYDWKAKEVSCPAGRGFSGHAGLDDPEAFRALDDR